MKLSSYRPTSRRFSSRIAKLNSRQMKSSLIAKRSFGGRRFWIKFFGIASTLVFASLIGMIVLTLFSFVIFAKDLPSPNKLSARDTSLSTKIYDRNGKLLYDIYGDKNRALVKWDSLPPYVKQATISIEDKDFYKHQGFSASGIVRSAFNIVFFRRLQGGSTI